MIQEAAIGEKRDHSQGKSDSNLAGLDRGTAFELHSLLLLLARIHGRAR